MLHLERPVLSLAIDAVVKVDSEDALCGLLTLFSKCKENLEDGGRLENMAWRLWHVERSSSHLYLPPVRALSSPGLVASVLTSSSSSSSEDDSDGSSDEASWDQDQQTAIHEDTGGHKGLSPTLSTSLSPSAAPQGGHPLKRRKASRRSSSPTSTGSQNVSPCRRPSLSSRRTHSNTSIGKIMADLLPEKLDVYGTKRVPSQGTLSEQSRWRESSLTLRSSTSEVPAVIVMPDVPVEHTRASSPQQSPHYDRNMRFPTVVIVNPTPHPTPPMTPQVSPPPTSPPNSAIMGHFTRRDTLSVATRIPVISSSSLPPTPESIEQKSTIEDRPPPRSEATPTPTSLLPPVSGPRTNGRPNGAGVGIVMPAHPIGSAITNHMLGKGNANGSGDNGHKLGAGAPGGASLNPPERKFFIAQHGSPDGDSPDTSASSQVGSQSALSMSIATSSVADNRATAATAAACEPASVASRASVSTARSHSSNGSSSRNGLRMKCRKGAAAVTKGKGKEGRHGTTHLQRTHSGGRIHPHLGVGGLSGGTIQRSKVGGRTAAATAAAAAAAASHFGQQLNARPHHGAVASGVSMHPPSPAPSRPSAQPQKPNGVSSKGKRSKSPARSSSSQRRSSTQSNTKTVNGGTSLKTRSPSATAGLKANGGVFPEPSSKQRKIEFADDSDFSTDEEWDTEDGSEEAERTNGEIAPSAADRKLAEAAAEAQRQRDLFAKVDRRSYTNLNRTNSGLLSSIFHPDPTLFPADHPYRYSQSTQDILAQPGRPLYQPAPLQPSKSTTAMPVAAAVNAEGVGSPNTGRKRSPLRLKGRPEEVEESDSGEDDEENKVQISASVAEQRLAALHKGKRPAQPSQLSQQHPAPQPQRQNSLPPVPPAQGSRYGLPSVGPSQLSRVATAPLGYPYNLPPPMPPSTPRTTRRNMLTHELSESLRRNLLWERQVSKQRPMGLGRRALTGNAPPNPPSNPPPSNGVLGNPLKPLTSSTTTTAGAGAGGPAPPSANGSGGANDAQTSENVDPRRQKALARNRSWADNYHAAGW